MLFRSGCLCPICCYDRNLFRASGRMEDRSGDHSESSCGESDYEDDAEELHHWDWYGPLNDPVNEAENNSSCEESEYGDDWEDRSGDNDFKTPSQFVLSRSEDPLYDYEHPEGCLCPICSFEESDGEMENIRAHMNARHHQFEMMRKINEKYWEDRSGDQDCEEDAWCGPLAETWNEAENHDNSEDIYENTSLQKSGMDVAQIDSKIKRSSQGGIGKHAYQGPGRRCRTCWFRGKQRLGRK